jgi:hypothetical protein
MKLKKIFRIIGQWIALSAIMLLLWMITMGIMTSLLTGGTSSSSEASAGVLLGMAAVSLINTAVIMYLIFRSRWHGIKLVVFVALVHYIVQFFMGGVEAIFFRASLQIPIKLVYAQLASGAVFAFLFALAAVLILGRMKPPKEAPAAPNMRLIMPKGEFILKFLILSIIVYPLLYFLFGYFVAWQFPAVREFYSGSTVLAPFFQFIRTQFATNSTLVFWQMARGAVWVLVALPVIRMLKGTSREAAVTLGLIFALVMNSQHIPPNPYMPGMVRLAHFIETASSNFLWGMLIVWLLHRKHASIPDLIRKQAKQVSLKPAPQEKP